ncbi:MAG: undecaprenyldiphospho-muramoylpentapeptide beta-N-acetylglucosaminyltransferase [Pseudomonadota bacterium]
MQMADLISGSKIVLTAGGTGGHMFPALALAQSLASRGCQVSLVTDERGAKYIKQPQGIEIKVLDLSRMSQAGLRGKLGGVGQLLARFWQMWRWMRRRKPDTVVGFGGYPAFPTLLSAVIHRASISLHEQNGVMGRVNRWFIRWATHVGVSFPGTQRIKPKYQHKVHLTGLPVRDSIKRAAQTVYALPKTGERFRVLVIGGSQGSGIFSDVVPQALAKLSDQQQDRLHVVQQCRGEHMLATKKAYKVLAVTSRLSGFIQGIASELAKAHLVITRAGASSTAELLTVGRPTIFVPYPHATDDHQTANAKYAQSTGMGWLISQEKLTAEVLARHIGQLLEHPQHLLAAAVCLRDVQ